MSTNPHKRPPRNPRFFGREAYTGRQDIVEDIHERLKPGSKYESYQKLKVCSMHIGEFGGTGKTQIAIEYTYRYEGTYADIFWVQADEPAESGERVLARLRESSPWLVVLDNALSDDSIKPYIPEETTAGSIIVTTNSNNVIHMWRCQFDVKVREFHSEEGAGFLLDRLNVRERSEKHRLEDTFRGGSNLMGYRTRLNNSSFSADVYPGIVVHAGAFTSPISTTIEIPILQIRRTIRRTILIWRLIQRHHILETKISCWALSKRYTCKLEGHVIARALIRRPVVACIHSKSMSTLSTRGARTVHRHVKLVSEEHALVPCPPTK